MDSVEIVLEKLQSEGIRASLEEYSILLYPVTGTTSTIRDKDIACADGKLAWFESDGDSSHLLRVFQNGENLNWEPITHNPVFGCDCLLIQWYKNHLIFIYIEKHDIFICYIANAEVKHFRFHGDQISKRADIVYFKDFGPDDGFIQRLNLSEISHLSPITAEEARLESIYPDSIDPITGLKDQ